MISGGIGTCVLGYADPDVDSAVHAAIDSGTSTHLNCPEEVELADLLCELHPWADMVRYARGGGEATTIAVRIARASTGRDKVAFCGYHGWSDWYLAANLTRSDALDDHLFPGLKPNGVPRGLEGTAIPFHYNRMDELQAIVTGNKGELAAIVMEPVRDEEPVDQFLEKVRALANECGAVLVFDEVTTGWRLTTGGTHLVYGVMPDIAVFAKAISNGYPMAAVIGTEEVMQAAQESFISSTYWSDRIGPVAALATIRKHRELDLSRHLIAMGELVQAGWRTAAERSGVPVHVGGLAPLSHISFGYENAQAVRTLFTQLMLERGFLAAAPFYSTYAHKVGLIEEYLGAVDEVFSMIAAAVSRSEVEAMLNGPVAHSGYWRLE
jgi:glutamate-1-semialdehyde 2,1-aminomutase